MIFLLELARGLAALWVFFYHVKSMFISSPILYSFASFGSLGVPMFFVISGYVITFSAESNLKNHKSPFVFLKSRFLRIYPAFWASVVVLLLTPYVIELISSLKTSEYLVPSNPLAKYSSFEWGHFLALTKVFFANSSDLQEEFNAINSVYWTLAIEFQFYCMVFIALWFKKIYRHIILAVSIGAFLMLVLPSPFNNGFFIHYWTSFSIGIALAYLHKSEYTFSSLVNIGAVKYFVILLSASILVLSTNYPGPASISFAASFGAFIWVISDFEKVLENIKRGENKFFYWFLEVWLILGTMSYSVYLLHGKIYQLPAMFVRQVIDSNSLLFGFVTILGTLLLCYPFYCLIERQFLSKNYKKIQQKVLTNKVRW